MRLRVLNVAYPLAPVCLDAVGGAEQILAQLDRALHEADHQSLVIALAGSRVHGRLFEIPAPSVLLDPAAIRRVETTTRELIDHVVEQHRVDLVHIHAVNFAPLMPDATVPTLVTLHLPRNYYATPDLLAAGENVWMHCVSRSQHATFSDVQQLLPPIENGVEIDCEAPYAGRRHYALWLGRICPEKAVHLAIDACRHASMPIRVAGRAFPFPAHVDYFREFIAPRMNAACRYVGAVTADRKRRLLRQARCLLITTVVPETSSLVAREALAAGTPVLALRSPALSELIENGRNGFLVDSAQELVAALRLCSRIDPDECMRTVRERCALEHMTRRYLQLYRLLAQYRRSRMPRPHDFAA